MKTIINPITKQGKVKCIHYYELCHTRWYDKFISIFVYENKIYLYIVEDPINTKKTLIEYGELEPLNMERALNQFKKNIF